MASATDTDPKRGLYYRVCVKTCPSNTNVEYTSSSSIETKSATISCSLTTNANPLLVYGFLKY